VAGGGSANPGDDGAATNARLRSPSWVTVDSSGNFFIADQGNNRIRKVVRSGVPTLTLHNVSAANAGNYQVIVTSPFGSVTSSNAILTVPALSPPLITSQPASQSQFAGT
jgi:hypothetical protein